MQGKSVPGLTRISRGTREQRAGSKLTIQGLGFYMDQCKQCGSGDMRVGITNLTNGSTVFPWYCGDCGDVSQQYVKKTTAHGIAIKQGKPLQYVKTRTQRHIEAGRVTIQPCEVCGTSTSELHHWAPRHLFGTDSEIWPKSYLCRKCHQKWHDLVTPNMSQHS